MRGHGRALARGVGRGAARGGRGARRPACWSPGLTTGPFRAWGGGRPFAPAGRLGPPRVRGGQGAKKLAPGTRRAGGRARRRRGRRRRPRDERIRGPRRRPIPPGKRGRIRPGAGVPPAEKRKGEGGRGMVKPPPWKAHRAYRGGTRRRVRPSAAVAWRRLASFPGVPAADAPEPLDDASAGYGPRGLVPASRQEDAMRLLRLEESAVARGRAAPGAGSIVGRRAVFGVRLFRGGFLLPTFRKRGATSRTRRRGVVPRGLPRLRVSVHGVAGPIPADFLAARRRRAALYAFAARARRRTDWKPAGGQRAAAPPVPARRAGAIASC